MLLISPGAKPVAVLLCFGREKPGPTGPCNVEIGAPIEGLRSLGAFSVSTAAMIVLYSDQDQCEAK